MQRLPPGSHRSAIVISAQEAASLILGQMYILGAILSTEPSKGGKEIPPHGCLSFSSERSRD